jgi:hypothetical protein
LAGSILTQGSINLAFNTQLYLQGFRVGQNSMNLINQLTQGALNFSLNGTQFATFDFDNIPASDVTLYKFPGTVYYKPGDTIAIQSTGASVFTRTFYLKSMDVAYTPAPLPILATATAFGLSRRLRSRVRRAAAVVHS